MSASANSVLEQERKQLFLQGLRQVLPSLKLLSDASLEKRIGKEKLQFASEDIASYLASGGCEKMMRNEQLALVCQVLNCLTRYITTELQIPATLNTVINNMSLLSYAVEQSFPGYATSGLLKYTILPPRSVA
jgi:hypothetical protein